MNEEAIEWDFVTLVDWWNLYGLPVLLVVVAIAVLIRSRSRPAAELPSEQFRDSCAGSG